MSDEGRRYARSAELTEGAARLISGGTSRVGARAPATDGGWAHPLFAASGSGARLTDVDGNEVIDFNNHSTALVHGHAHPRIVEAITKQAARGTGSNFSNEHEQRLAELICDRVAAFDRIRFCVTGTEAVLMAVRAARALTGRAKIAKFEGAYHGRSDFVDVSVEPDPEDWGEGDPSPVAQIGTPRSVTDAVVVLPYNETERARAILERHAGELACVVIDPFAPRTGPTVPSPGFLSMLREYTRGDGSLLVFDEVIAFRLSHGGAQGLYGATPDLTCLSKIIGGGLPIGAVAGPADFMDIFDATSEPALTFGGTYAANPLSTAAGAAALELLTADEVERINALGDRARALVREAFAVSGYPGQVLGVGSLFRPHLTTRPIRGYRSARWSPEERARVRRLQGHMLSRGVSIWEHQALCSISTPMGEEELERLAEALTASLRAMIAEGDVPGEAG